jgi:hypothetical protein
MKRFPWKVLTKKEDWLSGWPILILIQKAAMKNLHMNGSCLSALMTSLSSLLGWKGNLILYAILSPWLTKNSWCVIIIENRQEWAAYLPFLPSYRPEVWSGKTKSCWWRRENKCEDKPNGKITAAIQMSSVEWWLAGLIKIFIHCSPSAAW